MTAPAAAALLVITALSGCAQGSEPIFRTPIFWGSLGSATLGGEDVKTSLRLTDGSSARLVDFPRGTAGTETIDGQTYDCDNLSYAPSYTGKATWSSDGAGALIVKFGKSSIEVIADTDGYIGRTPDWDGVRISECGSLGDGSEWILGWQCGYAGTIDGGDLTAPCRP
jgi:hypothetical protein